MIYDGDTQVGQYERNHPGWGYETFEPFEIDGAWYALYSKEYTSTRVMSLPDCKDLGGEKPQAGGFCPVELYVPRYREMTCKRHSDGHETTNWLFEADAQTAAVGTADYGYDITYGPWQFLRTGFVAGCLWGDDSSWKMEVFDLTGVFEGKISRSARFGHLQLPRDMSLRASLHFDRHMPDGELRATVIRQERRDVATGKLIDPYDE